jgi:GT2 family glycosyltransferase
VVVPTHDTRDLTLACLASLRTATPRQIEVIVVDDGSRDGTAEAIAASHPGVRLVRHDQALGFTGAANAGAAAAQGDLLLFLNSDTEVDPGAIDAMLDAFESEPALGIGGAQLRYPGGEPQWSGGREPRPLWLLALASDSAFGLGGSALWRKLRPVSGHGESAVDWVPAAAMGVRREVWRTAGPFDPRFELYAQDLDLCLRAGDLGWRVSVVPGCKVVHHHGATVGGTAGVSDARHHRALLWADLVRCASKRGGAGAGRATARWLAAGGALRRARLALGVFRGADARRAARVERESLARAAAAARSAARAALPPGHRT